MQRLYPAIVLFLALFFLLSPAHAGDNGWKLQDTVTCSVGTGSAYTTVCAASGSYAAVSRAIPYANGLMAAALTVTGSGTAKVTYELSPNNVVWFTPVGATAILTGVTAAAPKYAQFSPDFGFWIRFTVTETGGASSLTGATLYLMAD